MATPKKQPCSACQRELPLDAFNPSSAKRRSFTCRPCLKKKNREYYNRAQENRLAWESARAHEGITLELYRSVVGEHYGRCLISGAIGMPLVLIPVSLRGPLDGEPLKSSDFVPVMRRFGHHSVLPEPHRTRFHLWLRAQNASSAPAPSVEAEAAPPAPRCPPLITKGMMVGAPKKSEIGRFLVNKAKEHGIDPVQIYEAVVFAANRRLSAGQ